MFGICGKCGKYIYISFFLSLPIQKGTLRGEEGEKEVETNLPHLPHLPQISQTFLDFFYFL
jgi:hypothetical protein